MYKHGTIGVHISRKFLNNFHIFLLLSLFFLNFCGNNCLLIGGGGCTCGSSIGYQLVHDMTGLTTTNKENTTNL